MKLVGILMFSLSPVLGISLMSLSNKPTVQESFGLIVILGFLILFFVVGAALWIAGDAQDRADKRAARA